MRLVFASNQLEIGGIETNIVRLTRELHNRGHDVVVVTRGGALVPAVEQAGGRHITIELSANLARLPSTVHALRAVLADADVVHVFSASAAVPVAMARRSLGRRRPGVVSSIMGLRTQPDEPAWRELTRAWATTFGADRVVVVAPAIDRVLRRLPVRSRRLVHHSVVGIDLPDREVASARRTARSLLGIHETVPLVMTIGRLDPTKSHELFIRSVTGTIAARPDARFVIIGEGALRSSLEKEVATVDGGDHVELLGGHHDADELVAAADVYVRPGIVEGFVGITVLEAQAWGVPVVSFDTEDVRLAIDDGRTGLLVPSGDVAGLANAITRLLGDSTLARSIGDAGREHVRATFALPAIVDKLEALYRSLAA